MPPVRKTNSNKSISKSKFSFWTVVVFVFLFTINLLPAIVLAVDGSAFSDSIVKKIGLISLSTLFFLIPFLFFNIRISFLINGLSLLFAPVEIVHILLYKASINGSFIMLVLQTDYHEVLELLLSFKLFIFIAILLYVSYFYVVIKFSPPQYLFSKGNRKWFYGSSIIIISLLYLYGYYIGFTISRNPITAFTAANHTFYSKLTFIYPLSFIISADYALKTNREVNESMEVLSDFSFNAKSLNNPDQKEIYVLIIGETARFSNFSINGYPRPTNPQLSKLDNIVSFRNVLAEACNTQIALPTILTRSTATNYDVYKTEKSVVEAFKEAGFSTYWIANQSTNYPLIRRIFNQCEDHYITTKDYDSVENYDENLFPDLESVLAKNDKKQFIVIHTLGSHFRYNFRYPKEFRKFRPDFEGAFGYDLLTESNKEKLINSYDNSILYTDFFISSTIQRIKNLNAQSFVYYLSDHAENMFEDGKILHGSTPNYFTMHIPLIVWYSDLYKSQNEEIVRNLNNNIYQKISASVSFNSLLQMGGISFDGQDFKKSVASEQLKSESLHYALSPDKVLFTFRYKK